MRGGRIIGRQVPNFAAGTAFSETVGGTTGRPGAGARAAYYGKQR